MPLKSDDAAKTGNSLREMKGFHPKSMSVYDSYAIVKRAGQGVEAFNFQQYVIIMPGGTWICCWTQGSTESAPDQRVVCSRSVDNGKTWSGEIVIEAAAPAYRVPAWVMPFAVLHSGRLYMFYWYNYNDDAIRDGGDMFFRYSDDEGLSWSERHRIGIPRTAMDDSQGDLHGWNFGPFVMMPDCKPVMNYNKIKRSSMLEGNPDKWETEAFFMKCENILWETDPKKLVFSFYPEGDHGLFVRHPVNGQNFGQEATLLSLSGGKTLAVFRTRTGHPYYAISRDGARTWSSPEPLRLGPNGSALLQPCASMPIKKLKDGRVVLLYHNTMADGSGWNPRHPLWILVGREATATLENGGLLFGSPRILLYNDSLPGGTFHNNEISYPELFEWAGKVFVAYSNKTEEIRISEIDPELLDDFGLPISSS